MYNHGFHDWDREPTPTERCRNMLVELRREQKNDHPNVDHLVHLRMQISQFPLATQEAAFNYLVDTNGW